MVKTDLTFSTFCLAFVDFAVQFYFRCNFSSHERRRLSQASQWRDFPELIKNSFPRIATNEFAAFRTEYRLGQILLFSCLPFWAKAGFRVMKDHHSALVCFFVSLQKTQNTSKCGKKISDKLCYCLVHYWFALTTFWGHLWSNWTDAWHHWICLVNITTCMTGIRFHFWYHYYWIPLLWLYK